MKHILVKAEWDAEARVWVAQSDDLAGLVTEADTMEGLRLRLLAIIDDLFDLDGEAGRSYSLDIIARSFEQVHPVAA